MIENKSISAYSDTDYESFEHYERYKFLLKHVLPDLPANGSLLDIGCAKGELLYLIGKRVHGLRLCGLEYAEELIQKAQQQPLLSSMCFVQGDAADFDLGESFDVTVMSGVLSIFEDFVPPLEAMLTHTSPGGTGFVFGGFTRDDIDVIVRYRNNLVESPQWESGWTMFSLKTIERWLAPRVESYSVIPFELSIDLERKEGDPTRSYTMTTQEGERLILTGGNVVRDFHLITFKMKK